MGQGCCKEGGEDIVLKRYRLQDYKLVQCVGKGGFGKVWMVLHRASNKTYALKIMKKLLVLNKNGHKSVVNERTILQGLDHP
jgi:serine/threonine protein kinase